MKKGIVLGDLHCGSLVGLTPPEYIQPEVEKTQLPLWNWYIEKIKSIGKVDFVVANGDLIDGPGKKDTIGHFTTNTKKQRDIAIQCLEHIDSAKWYFTYGTPFHVTETEDYEASIAEHFDSPIKDQMYLEIEGHRCMFRHHVGRSDTPYGQGTQIYKEVVRDLIMALEEEEQRAGQLFFSHVHYEFHIGNHRASAYTTPCFQVPESVYGRKMRSVYYDLGLYEIRANENKFEVIPHIMPIKFVRRRDYEKV